MTLTREELARRIDHTNLKPTATREDIRRLCEEARKHGFASVCVNGCWVEECARMLFGTPVKVCAVAGFPLGAADTVSKAREAERAVEQGAGEIDMVANIGWLLAGEKEPFTADVRAVVEAVPDACVKVILEVGYLDDARIVAACEMAEAAGADFVKTSTGFGPAWSMEQLKLMVKSVPGMKVKAAGGIRSYEDAVAALAAGAHRLGASAGVKLLEGAEP